MPTTKRPEDKKRHDFARSDWEAVSDNPEWTEADFARAKPFAELFPEVVQALRKDRGHR